MEYSKKHMSRFLAIFSILLSGCVASGPIPAVAPGSTQTAGPVPVRPTATLLPAATATPEILATAAGTPAACPSEVLDEYLDLVLPLADQHTVDSYQAQKMEGLGDVGQVAALREAAAGRLAAFQAIQPPACALEIQAKLGSSFEMLLRTWDLIEAQDYVSATRILQDAVVPLAEAIALIAEMQAGER